MRVLFVDDEEDILEQAGIFLEREYEGLDVDTAVSPDRGLEMYDRIDYDAIISDYQMPIIDGLEFLEIVRQDKGDDIPFIIFTGKGREEVAMEALNLGANRYIQKGGSPRSQYAVLTDAVEQEVKRKRSEEELQKFSSMVTNSSEAMIYTDKDFKITYMNESAKEMFGYTLEDLEGKKFDVLYDTSEDEIQDRLYEKISSSEAYKGVHLNERKDGSKFYCEVKISSITDGEDKINGYLGIQRDITERKKAEMEIKHLNSLLKAIRNVNRIILQGKGVEEIMQNASEYLVGARSYLECNIGLLDERTGEIYIRGEAGTGNLVTDWSIREDGSGDGPPCIKKCIRSGELKVFKTQKSDDCRLKDNEELEQIVIVPIKRYGNIVGVLHLGIDKHVSIDDEERQLLKEVASDLAFAREKIKAEKESESQNY